VQRYRGRISGPLLDRIDLQVEVARPRRPILPSAQASAESSAAVRRRVITARRLQLERAGLPNAALDSAGVRAHCRLAAEQRHFLEQAAERTGLSPRGCQRVLKVARTVADLGAAREIGTAHLAEAIAYRGTDCGKRQG